MDRALEWFFVQLGNLFRMIDHSPAAKHGLLAIFIVIVLGVVAHLFLTVYIPGTGQSARWTLRGARSGTSSDPWALAQRLAAEGRYTEAAHALYGALLTRVAARVTLRLHPSKTAGDYARDLRVAAPSVFGPFREFARDYEVVIYGLGTCDQPRFERLIDLAGRIDPELNQLAHAGAHG
jgi:hypothetical protein